MIFGVEKFIFELTYREHLFWYRVNMPILTCWLAKTAACALMAE